MGDGRFRPLAGRDHDHGRDPRDRRRDRPDGLWRADRIGRLPRLRPQLPGRPDGPDDAGLRGPGDPSRGARGPQGRPPAQRDGAAQGRHRALRLSAERRRCRHGGLSRRVREPAQHAARHARRGLRRDAARDGRRSAARDPERQRGAPRPARQRRGPDRGRRFRLLRAASARDRGAMGPVAGPGAVGRVGHFRARRAFRQRLRRHPAGLRLRGRSDAASLREGLRADTRLQRLLPLSARGFRRRRRPAFRHAWRSRIHARQAERARRRLLARPADRGPAQRLSLRREQPFRERAGQAPHRGHDRHLSHAAGDQGRALQGSGRSQGLARPLAGLGPRRAGARRSRDAAPGPGGGAGPLRVRAGLVEPGDLGRKALARRARIRGFAHPPRPPCRRPSAGRRGARRASRRDGRGRGLRRRDAGARRPAAGRGSRDARAPSRAGGALHPAGSGRRSAALAADPADGAQPARVRSFPDADRLRARGRRAPGEAASRPARGAGGGAAPLHRARALGRRQHQIRRRPGRPGPRADGRAAPLRRLRTALRRGTGAAGRTRAAPRSTS